MTDVHKLADYISMQAPVAWENCFEAAMERYDSNWLKSLDFMEILEFYGFTEDFYFETIKKHLPVICEDEMLDRICWLMHYILFYGDAASKKAVYNWGSGDTPFQNHGSDVMCVVALLAAQPLHAENMRKRGYDDEQIAFHKRGVRNTWLGEHEDYGTDGISFRLLAWGVHYINCALVRLGRLMYQNAPGKYPDYEQELGEDVFIIDLHIPSADNGLQDAEVEASIQLAKERLGRYFPEAVGKTIAVAVSTWLLSPQLKQILKPDSNIVKFQNRFNITKFYEGTQSFLVNAFHITAPVNTVDLDALPEDTGLRREVKKILQCGGALQNGKGYFICK